MREAERLGIPSVLEIPTGHRNKGKGVATLWEAWRMADLPEAKLVLNGAPQPEVRELLRELLAGVIVRGAVHEVAAEMRSACWHVLPSGMEGSAQVTFEAAACWLPRITAREAGDAVVDGETGWVIPARNPEALAQARREAAADWGRLEAMGRKAHRRVLDHFTREHMRRRLLEGYSRAIERVGRGATREKF